MFRRKTKPTERKLELTELELNALLNQHFLKGYNRGFADGERNAILNKVSVNKIREILGLKPIEKTE